MAHDVAAADAESPGKSTSPWGYQPALDGLRALAVLGVLLYHGDVGWMRGGFLGVDAFFVLSGFLITSLLWVELKQNGRVDQLAFWGRRLRRLLPALLLVLIVTAGFAALWGTTRDAGHVRADGLWTLVYGSNWWFIAARMSYFDQFGVPSPLRHTWSLAIEEQFYLVWPLLFPLLARVTRFRRAVLVPILGASAVASAVLMAVLFRPGTDPSRVYYGTDTRVQSILIGAALAVWMAGRARRAHAPESSRVARWSVDGLAIVAIVALGAAWAAIGDTNEHIYRGGFLLASVLVATVIVAAVQPRGVVRSVLSWQPLRAIGMISYGLYLWHWPVYVWWNADRTGLQGGQLLALRLAITAAISVASYFLVEQPVRTGRVSRRVFVVGAPAVAALTVLALLISTGGLVNRIARDRGGVNAVALVSSERKQSQDAAQNAVAAQPSAVRAMLVGDSVAATLGVTYAADQAGTPLLAVNTVADLGCGVVEGTLFSDGAYRASAPWCGRWSSRWEYGRDELRPDVNVLLTGAWEVFTRRVDGQRLEFGSPEFEAYLRSRLEYGIDILAANGAPVLILTAPCFGYVHAAMFPWGTERADPERVAWINDLFRSIAAERPRQVRVVDLHAHICPLARWDNAFGGTPMLPDAVHFSDPGGREVWKWLAPQVDTVARHGLGALNG